MKYESMQNKYTPYLNIQETFITNAVLFTVLFMLCCIRFFVRYLIVT